MEESEIKPKKCDTKLKFSSKKEAEGAKVYAEHRHNTKLKIYLCKSCQLWHLSSD